MLRNLAEKEEPKEENYDNIDDETKEVEINENREVNDELVIDAANGAPPPQDAQTTTTNTAETADEFGNDD